MARAARAAAAATRRRRREIILEFGILNLLMVMLGEESINKSLYELRRFIIARTVLLFYKPTLHRPADQRAAVAVPVRVFSISLRKPSTFNALTSISAAKAPLGARLVAATGEPNA